jgi:hypothetical protein
MISSLRVFASSLFIIPLLLGCKTLSDPAVIQFVSARAGDAARIAVGVDLESNPDHRAAFVAGVAALDGLMRSTNYSSALFSEALAQLPIEEFRGDNGALILEGGLLVFDLVTMFAYDIESQPALLSVMTSVRNGIAAALDSTAASRARVSRSAPAMPPAPLVAKRTRRI